MSDQKHKILSASFSKALPIICSYIVIAAAYGMMMADIGIAWYWAVFASMVVYSGALLFVLVTFLAAGTPLLTVGVTALLMGSRQCFYALTFLDDIKRMGAHRHYMIHLMTDETFAVDCTLDLPEEMRAPVMQIVAIFSHLSWLLGSGLGAAAGQFIPFDLTGIDFAMTAMFAIIFIDQWKKYERHAPALIGLGVGIVFLLIFGADRFIMPALLATSALLLIDGRRNPE